MKVKTICKRCELAYEYNLVSNTPEINTIYCLKCRHILNDNEKRLKKEEKKKSQALEMGACKRCGKPFIKTSPYKLYCSDECKRNYCSLKPIEIRCLKCSRKITFTQNNYWKDKSPILCKFCRSDLIKKDWAEEDYIKSWAKGVLHNHKSFGHVVNITLEELVQLALKTQYCVLCGAKLSYRQSKTYEWEHHAKCASMDRIVNNTNYTIDDVDIICSTCNAIKKDISFDRLKEVIFGYVNYIRKIDPLFLK